MARRHAPPRHTPVHAGQHYDEAMSRLVPTSSVFENPARRSTSDPRRMRRRRPASSSGSSRRRRPARPRHLRYRPRGEGDADRRSDPSANRGEDEKRVASRPFPGACGSSSRLRTSSSSVARALRRSAHRLWWYPGRDDAPRDRANRAHPVSCEGTKGLWGLAPPPIAELPISLTESIACQQEPKSAPRSGSERCTIAGSA